MNDLVALALVNGVIWIGIFTYLWRLDVRVRRMERDEEE